MKINTKYRQIRDDFNLNETELYKRISELEPSSITNKIFITWDKATDFSVFDDQGNKWIDLTSGIFVTNAGHSNPKIKQAIKDQVDSDLLFSYSYPTHIREKFISRLLELSPKQFDHAILLSSGSEATDDAYKLIRIYGNKNNRKYIITFKGSFHGRGLSLDLISGSKEKAAWSGVHDENVVFIDFPYEGNEKFDPSILPPADQIAGFMIETFQGWGAWFYPKNFINDLCKFAKGNGILTCFDEMQAGFYRLGTIYGYFTYGKEIEPDILCLGKGITSSLPLSAVLSRKEIIGINPEAELRGTHSGSPVCCAAALANIDFLSSEHETRRREETMKVFEESMIEISKLKPVKKINYRGLIAGIIFEDTETATKVVFECIKNGVLPVCTNKKSVKIAPPLTITKDAIKEFTEVLSKSISSVG